MKKPITNVPASVRARLLQRSKEVGEDFSLVLQRYAAERFLYRLGRSPYRSRFVLKGAMLFAIWGGSMYRSTRDLDLMGFGPGGEAALAEAVRAICETRCEDDGIEFIASTVRVEPIRDASEYVGFRARLNAALDGARIRLQVDVGYGDAIAPAPEEVDCPTLIPMSAPRIRTYRREPVVAEKLHAMVVLGEANSRFKDFFDIQYLAGRFEFDRQTLIESVRRTFERRRTDVPADDPVALTKRFWNDPRRPEQLKAFGRRTGLDVVAKAGEETLATLVSFLLPILDDLRRGVSVKGTWPPGGPWR